MKFIKGKFAESVNYLFQTLLVTYLILLLFEQIWQGIVSVYLNLNWLLIFVIIIGILDVFSEVPHKHEGPTRKKDYVFVFILGIVAWVIIKFKTESLGWLSWVIALVAAALVVLLSVLVLEEKENV